MIDQLMDVTNAFEQIKPLPFVIQPKGEFKTLIGMNRSSTHHKPLPGFNETLRRKLKLGRVLSIISDTVIVEHNPH